MIEHVADLGGGDAGQRKLRDGVLAEEGGLLGFDAGGRRTSCEPADKKELVSIERLNNNGLFSL